MAASSGAARPPLRSGAKIETFGTNFQAFCPYFFCFCPNPLDRCTIVFQTGCSGTANRDRKGGKLPGAGRSSAGKPTGPRDVIDGKDLQGDVVHTAQSNCTVVGGSAGERYSSNAKYEIYTRVKCIQLDRVYLGFV